MSPKNTTGDNHTGRAVDHLAKLGILHGKRRTNIYANGCETARAIKKKSAVMSITKAALKTLNKNDSELSVTGWMGEIDGTGGRAGGKADIRAERVGNASEVFLSHREAAVKAMGKSKGMKTAVTGLDAKDRKNAKWVNIKDDKGNSINHAQLAASKAKMTFTLSAEDTRKKKETKRVRKKRLSAHKY